MSQLIETIRLMDGAFYNVDYHEQRMHRSRTELWGNKDNLNLAATLHEFSKPEHGLFKCRIVYDHSIHEVAFSPYTTRPVNSVKLVYDDVIEYHHKFKDRSRLDCLFEERGHSDDILIIKEGFVTDTSRANIIFKKGKEWVTPSSCLLPGTQRQLLLDRKLIREDEIQAKEIGKFTAFKLINSMLMSEVQEVPVHHIVI